MCIRDRNNCYVTNCCGCKYHLFSNHITIFNGKLQLYSINITWLVLMEYFHNYCHKTLIYLNLFDRRLITLIRLWKWKSIKSQKQNAKLNINQNKNILTYKQRKGVLRYYSAYIPLFNYLFIKRLEFYTFHKGWDIDIEDTLGTISRLFSWNNLDKSMWDGMVMLHLHKLLKMIHFVDGL